MRARLYIRVRLKDGRHPFVEPVYSANNKIKPQYALVDGKPEHHPEGSYYLRYLRNGKRVWEPVGDDASTAVTALRKRNAILGAEDAEVEVVPEPSASTVGQPLAPAIAEYLGEIKLTKKKKTYAAYSVALRYFQEFYKKRDLDQVGRSDMLRFHAYLRDERGQSARSCWNKFSNVMSFLKARGITSGVKKNDWPRYAEDTPEAYDKADLDKLFSVCDHQERLYFEFFLMTGMREQEVVHTFWSDVNFGLGTVTVSAKSAYGFTPKNYKGREIPIPASLVESLKAAKEKATRGCPLLFPTSGCKPKNDFLDILKARAKAAGFSPDDFWLHKFRATFATWHLQAGVDLCTVQLWLGHKDLASTMRYLKPARGEEVQRKVNYTFGTFVGVCA